MKDLLHNIRSVVDSSGSVDKVHVAQLVGLMGCYFETVSCP